MSNMYYTFNQKYNFRPYTVKDIAKIIAQYNPVQLVIDDNWEWDNKYNSDEAYDKVIEKFSDKNVAELWVSTLDDNNHSLIKITTWENDNGA